MGTAQSNNSVLTKDMLSKDPNAMKVVVISDTHLYHHQLTEKIPPCDLLIHCGDFSMVGTSDNIDDFASWLESLVQCKNIVVIAVSFIFYHFIIHNLFSSDK